LGKKSRRPNRNKPKNAATSNAPVATAAATTVWDMSEKFKKMFGSRIGKAYRKSNLS